MCVCLLQFSFGTFPSLTVPHHSPSPPSQFLTTLPPLPHSSSPLSLPSLTVPHHSPSTPSQFLTTLPPLPHSSSPTLSPSLTVPHPPPSPSPSLTVPHPPSPPPSQFLTHLPLPPPPSQFLTHLTVPDEVYYYVKVKVVLPYLAMGDSGTTTHTRIPHDMWCDDCPLAFPAQN